MGPNAVFCGNCGKNNQDVVIGKEPEQFDDDKTMMIDEEAMMAAAGVEESTPESFFDDQSGFNDDFGMSGQPAFDSQPSYEQPSYEQPSYDQPVYNQPAANAAQQQAQVMSKPADWKNELMTPSQYLGWLVVYCIVPFGWIAAIVHAAGTEVTINKQNFARGFLIYWGILIAISLIGTLVVFGSIAGLLGALGGSYYYY